MIDLGVVKPGSTVRIPFSTFSTAGAAVTMTNFAAADVLVYKDGSTTERASTSGYTATTDFDTKTGKHLIVIDLADNTTADFFAAGSEYLVAVDSVTVDSQTVGTWVARFCIGYPGAVLDTTIATLASQTSFTLTAGPAEDDALNGLWAIIHDAASAVQSSAVQVLDYTGSTKTVTLAAGATFTVAAKDNISFIVPMPLQAATIGRTLSVSAAGEAQADVAKIAGAAVSTSTAQIGVNVVNFGGSAGTFASGRPEVNTTHIAGSAVSTSSAQIGVNVVNAGGTAWGSGAITSGVFAAGAISASSIAADAIGASELAADAVAEIADAVWDEVLSGHLTGGTTGAGLNAAGSAGDPWSTALPGAYSAGTAGYIVGTNLDAIVSSRLASASYTAPLDAAGTRSAVGLASANLDTQLAAIAAYIDTEVATIVTQTSAASIRSAVGLASANLDTQLTTLDDFLDTEIAAIKAKTDNLPAAPAATGDIPSATTIADAILSRNVSNVESSAPEHSLCTIILASLESSISGTTWTIKRTNGSTTHATKIVTVDAAADPITGVS